MRGPGQVPRDWHPSRQSVEALCSDRKAPDHLSRQWVPSGAAAPPSGRGWGSRAETAGFRQGEMVPSTQAVCVQSPGSQDWLMGRRIEPHLGSQLKAPAEGVVQVEEEGGTQSAWEMLH